MRPTTSPIAQIPGTLVDIRSLTSIPFLVYLTPTEARSRPPKLGILPTADNTRSARNSFLAPSLPEAMITFSLPSDLTSDTWVLVFIDMPLFFRIKDSRCDISLSMLGRIVGRSSMIVTSDPKAAKMDANSTPITPPPMMASLSGT